MNDAEGDPEGDPEEQYWHYNDIVVTDAPHLGRKVHPFTIAAARLSYVLVAMLAAVIGIGIAGLAADWFTLAETKDIWAVTLAPLFGFLGTSFALIYRDRHD